MTTRIFILLLTSLLMASCATENKSVSATEKEPEILKIYPDGTMEYKGRIMNDEDVVIYKDGHGGERAAVKLIIPRHPDAYRDTIIVEREVIDVLVAKVE
jgi:hypothetical protein